jgi:hypothetical protein
MNKKEDIQVWMKSDPASLRIGGLTNLVLNGLLCCFKMSNPGKTCSLLHGLLFQLYW